MNLTINIPATLYKFLLHVAERLSGRPGGGPGAARIKYQGQLGEVHFKICQVYKSSFKKILWVDWSYQA